MVPTPPDYDGSGLVNLAAELERRLVGSSPSPGLRPGLRELVPEAPSYVFVLFDGLGDHQLDHRRASPLAACRAAALDAPFPTTTTVSLATIATALPPSRHGLIGYQMWLPDAGEVVNTIRWTTLWGDAIDFDPAPLLPAPNLWERLSGAGLETVTVQPANFAGSGLSRALYRGCRFEAITNVDEWVTATAQLAATPGRLVFAYLPQVDFAAHVHGQDSAEYAGAVATVSLAWERLSHALPAGAALVGCADHGHVDFPPARQTRIERADHDGRRFSGDGRAMFVHGDGAALASALPARWVPIAEALPWWGPGPSHEAFAERAPDGILLADPGHLLLHRFSDDRMIGNHGGLTEAERRVPLLVG